MHRPRIVPHLRMVQLGAEQLALLGEDERHLLQGRAFESVLPLADGSRRAEEIVAAVSDRVPAAEAYYALAIATQRGYVREAPQAISELLCYLDTLDGLEPNARQKVECARLEVLALGGLDPEPMEQALRASELEIATNPNLTVVLATDYLDPSLEDLNARFCRDGQDWVLVKPTGVRAWIGPLLGHGGPCWRCLAQRLRMNHPLEVWIREHRGILDSAPILGHAGSRHLAMSIASQYILRWIAGNTLECQDRSLVTFDMRALRAEPHTVCRRPQCPSCGNADWLKQQMASAFEMQARPIRYSHGGYRIFAPESVLKRCERLVDCVTGAVVSIEPVPQRENPLLSVMVGNYFAPPSEGRPTVEQLARCSLGKGRTTEQSMLSALGEALERYSAAFQGDEPRLLALPCEISDPVDPLELILVSDAQYSARETLNRRARTRAESIPAPYPKDQSLHWTQVWSLTRPGHARYVPSATCYVGVPELGEADAFPYNSNGDAAGSCVEEAVLQGLLEVVERDAVGIWWYNRLVRPAVDIEAFNDAFLDELCRYYAVQGVAVWLLDVTTEFGIPTFVAYGETRDAKRFSIGCGSHLDPRLAAERALTEFNQLYDPTGKHPLPWEPQEHFDPSFLWPDPSASPKQYAVVEPPQDIRTAVLSVVAKLARAGLEVLVLNRTRPDLELSVARVIVPGLRHFWRRLAPGRLYTVPVAMGWRDRALLESELNPVPLRL